MGVAHSTWIARSHRAPGPAPAATHSAYPEKFNAPLKMYLVSWKKSIQRLKICLLYTGKDALSCGQCLFFSLRRNEFVKDQKLLASEKTFVSDVLREELPGLGARTPVLNRFNTSGCTLSLGGQTRTVYFVNTLV